MAINPGIIDHKLIPEILDKISHLKEKLHDYPHMLIGIDGGINFENAPGMLKAGATLFVCGSQTIFRPKEATIDKKINQLRKILDNALI
jgi:ribulose-phosphate 3-epimerase